MPTRGWTTGGERASHYDPTLSPTHLTGLWQSCPLLEYQFDPSIGVLLDESFVSFNAQATTGDYVSTAATAGTATIGTAEPGVLVLDSGSTTQGQGIQVQRTKAGFVPAAGKDIWFEAKVKAVTSVSLQTLIGLAAADTSLIATNAQSTNNRMGFGSVTGDGVLLFQSDKAGTGTTAAATTLVAGTYQRLGFYYNGTADTLQQYVNGVAVGTALATTHIPKVVVYPSFVAQTNGTTQPLLHVAGYRVFQLR